MWSCSAMRPSCASLVNTRQAMSGASPAEQVSWCHSVQCATDDIAHSLGLYKVKVLIGAEDQSCLFVISPDMPSTQQADIMLEAAQQLQQALSKLQTPSGQQLSVKVTIHAGKYAGAVVGRTAWTYDLFGDDVSLLLDMDRSNTPNSIQLSEAALALVSSSRHCSRFTPAGTVCTCEGRSIQMYSWAPQDASGIETAGQSQQQQTATQSCCPSDSQPSNPQDVSPPASPAQQSWQPLKQQQAYTQIEQQHQQQQQVRQRQWQRGGTRAGRPTAAAAAAAAGAASLPLLSQQPPGAMQQNLRFADPQLELAYVQAQGEQLAHMDLLFILLNLAVTFCCIWDTSSRSSSNSSSSGGPAAAGINAFGQLVLRSWGQWVLLPLWAAWLLLHRSSYSRWREQLWVCHRLLPVLLVVAGAALHAVHDSWGMTPPSELQGFHKGPTGAGEVVAAGSGAWGAVLAAAATTAIAAVSQGALGLHTGRALALLAENLGFKVRFYVHMLTNTTTCVLVLLATLWHWSSSGGAAELQLWQLMQYLLLGWAAPTLLMWVWEVDDRARFLESLQQKQNKQKQNQKHQQEQKQQQGQGPACAQSKCKDV